MTAAENLAACLGGLGVKYAWPYIGCENVEIPYHRLAAKISAKISAMKENNQCQPAALAAALAKA